jgi:hypothetical protein
MADWRSDIEVCRNCTGGSVRYSYGARGYCGRCYRLIKRIEDVRAWKRSRPATLKRIPKDGSFDPAVGYNKSTRLITDGFTDEQFEICREEYTRQLERRLELLRHQEEIRRHEVPVDAWTLERKFAQILRLIRPKAEYPLNASYLNMHFDEATRRVIYALLEEIIEHAPWRGVDWSQVCERVYPTGKRA